MRNIQEAGLKIWFFVPVALALLASAIYLFVVFYRLQYPFELEWIEGAYLDQARWLALGNELFASPVIEFIPTNKTPIFFIIASVFVRWFGEGFFAVRFLSNLAVLGTIFLLWKLIYQQTKRYSAALVSVGLYLASYSFTGSWMDLGKTDSLFLFFLLLGFYWYINSKKFSWVFVSFCFVLAYFTKQLALPILITMAGVSLIFTRFSTWKLWLFTGFLGLGSFFLWDFVSHGWFSFYTFDTTIYHSINSFMLWNFWAKVLPKWWPSLLILAMFTGITLWNLKNKKISYRWFVATMGLCLGLLAASWSVFFKVWTYDNDLMPIALGSALIGGLSYGEFANWYKIKKNKAQAIWWSALIVLLTAQFILWRYDPLRQIPTEQDHALGNKFVSFLSSLEGDVWVYNHGFYTALAGKQTFLHSSPFGDIAGISPSVELPADTATRRNQTLSVVNHAVQSQRFSWVFVDKNPDSWLPYYLPFFHFFEEEGFFPVTGAPTRPEFGLFRNPVINGGSYPLTDPAFDTFYSDNWKIVQDGRGLVGENGDILIALSAKNSYSLEMQIKPRCEQDRPIINKFTWYWNNSLLVDVSVNDCADIKIGPIKIPQDAISSKYDSLSVTLQEFDQRNDTGNWNFELRELSFDRIDGISKE